MNVFHLAKDVLIGRARNLSDKSLFHKTSLVALLAWVGLGADGLSSSCYGPEAAFVALKGHHFLSLFVAAAVILTIVVICASYSQIIELFPSGGGGYLVASKLLSPATGVVSGCALIGDYVLTIAISVASGTEALFSLLPPAWETVAYRTEFAAAGVIFLSILNLRGVKESVLVWMPAFLLFVSSFAFVIIYGVATHIGGLPAVAERAGLGYPRHHGQLRHMGIGHGGFACLQFRCGHLHGHRGGEQQHGIVARTTRANRQTNDGLYGQFPLVRCRRIAADLPALPRHSGGGQNVECRPGGTNDRRVAGMARKRFCDCRARFVVGAVVHRRANRIYRRARVLANMAVDRWMPTRFANLSDRLVTQNGILLMGAAALAVILLTEASMDMLIVLYSINVFITFSLSQLGMVRHWWSHRANEPKWRGKIFINGFGLLLTGGILISLCVVKFFKGGWVTLLVTGLLIAAAFRVKRHYSQTQRQLQRLDNLVPATMLDTRNPPDKLSTTPCDPNARTAIFLVNGFNGLGLHTLLAVIRMFPKVHHNFVFLQVGVLDAGTFKGAAEVENLREHSRREAERYAAYMRQRGFYTESHFAVGTDVVDEAARLCDEVAKRFPQAQFFAGQLVFKDETFLMRWLHNHTVFELQRRLYRNGRPMLILPIQV